VLPPHAWIELVARDAGLEVYAPGEPNLTAPQARQLAAALVEWADAQEE
jgi:hypothetical protein